MLHLYLTHMHSCNQPSQTLTSKTLEKMKLFCSDIVNAGKAGLNLNMIQTFLNPQVLWTFNDTKKKKIVSND